MTAWTRLNTRATSIDVGLTGGETFDLGSGWTVDVLHTPGHSWGSIRVYDSTRRSLILGDAVLGTSVLNAVGAPAFPPTYRYVDTYLTTIHRLQALPIDRLLTSHYPIYKGSAVAEFLAESRAFVARVGAALRQELVAAGSCTMRELIEALAPRLGAWTEGARYPLSQPLGGHLERLMQWPGHHIAARRPGRPPLGALRTTLR